MTPQINHLRNMSPVLRVSTHIYGISKEIDGKTFIFRVNLGMWPLKMIVSEKQALFWGFNTHLWDFQGDRWENINFLSKPRHVTPQNDHLRKMSPVLRVSTHIYGVSKEIHGKTFIFQVNLGMWPLKSILSEKWALLWGFQHTFLGFLRRYMGKDQQSGLDMERWLTPGEILLMKDLLPKRVTI